MRPSSGGGELAGGHIIAIPELEALSVKANECDERIPGAVPNSGYDRAMVDIQAQVQLTELGLGHIKDVRGDLGLRSTILAFHAQRDRSACMSGEFARHLAGSHDQRFVRLGKVVRGEPNKEDIGVPHHPGRKIGTPYVPTTGNVLGRVNEAPVRIDLVPEGEFVPIQRLLEIAGLKADFHGELAIDGLRVGIDPTNGGRAQGAFARLVVRY